METEESGARRLGQVIEDRRLDIERQWLQQVQTDGPSDTELPPRDAPAHPGAPRPTRTSR